jgi:DNA-binding XRE family transcriptional regulator
LAQLLEPKVKEVAAHACATNPVIAKNLAKKILIRRSRIILDVYALYASTFHRDTVESKNPQKTCMLLRKAFGFVVSSERKRRDLTQTELAERCGLHFTAVSMVERGSRPANFDTLVLISSALEVPLSHLFRLAEELERLNPDL